MFRDMETPLKKYLTILRKQLFIKVHLHILQGQLACNDRNPGWLDVFIFFLLQ